MSSLDHSNEQDDQASINAGQESFAADGEATNNSNSSATSVSSSSADPALSLNTVAALTASAGAQVAASTANDAQAPSPDVFLVGPKVIFSDGLENNDYKIKKEDLAKGYQNLWGDSSWTDVGELEASNSTVIEERLYYLITPDSGYTGSIDLNYTVGNSSSANAIATQANNSLTILEDDAGPIISRTSPNSDSIVPHISTETYIGESQIPLSLYFNEQVKAGSGNVTLQSGEHKIILSADDFNWHDEYRSYSTPSGSIYSHATYQLNSEDNGTLLNPEADYHVLIDEGFAIDLSNKPFSGVNNTTTITFKTDGDGTPPALIPDYNLSNNRKYIDTSLEWIPIKFNEAVERGSGFITLSNGSDDTRKISVGNNDELTIELANDSHGDNTATAKFLVGEELKPNENYFVLIDETAFKDLSGNYYAGIQDPTEWNFSTEGIELKANNTTAGVIEYVHSVDDPNNKLASNFSNSSDVDWVKLIVEEDRNYTIAIKNEEIYTNGYNSDRPTPTQGAAVFEIVDSDGNLLSGEKITTTEQNLEAGTYYAQVSWERDHRPWNAYYELEISADATPPQIYFSIPNNNASNINTRDQIQFIFNEQIQAGSGKIRIISEVDEREIDVSDASQINIDENILIINPSQPLEENTNYKVEYSEGVITDTERNSIALTGESAIAFTTGNEIESQPELKYAINIPNQEIALHYDQNLLHKQPPLTAFEVKVEGQKVELKNIRVYENIIYIRPDENIKAGKSIQVSYVEQNEEEGAIQSAAGDNITPFSDITVESEIKYAGDATPLSGWQTKDYLNSNERRVYSFTYDGQTIDEISPHTPKTGSDYDGERPNGVGSSAGAWGSGSLVTKTYYDSEGSYIEVDDGVNSIVDKLTSGKDYYLVVGSESHQSDQGIYNSNARINNTGKSGIPYVINKIPKQDQLSRGNDSSFSSFLNSSSRLDLGKISGEFNVGGEPTNPLLTLRNPSSYFDFILETDATSDHSISLFTDDFFTSKGISLLDSSGEHIRDGWYSIPLNDIQAGNYILKVTGEQYGTHRTGQSQIKNDDGYHQYGIAFNTPQPLIVDIADEDLDGPVDLGSVKAGQTKSSLAINSSSDIDRYRFVIDDESTAAEVKLIFDRNQLDLNLELYTPDGDTPIYRSLSKSPTTPSERDPQWSSTSSIYRNNDLEKYGRQSVSRKISDENLIRNDVLNDLITIDKLPKGTYDLVVSSPQNEIGYYDLSFGGEATNISADRYEDYTRNEYRHAYPYSSGTFTGNDTVADAIYLGGLSTGNNIISNLSIHSSEDVDYFILGIGEDMQHPENLSIKFDHALGDLKVENVALNMNPYKSDWWRNKSEEDTWIDLSSGDVDKIENYFLFSGSNTFSDDEQVRLGLFKVSGVDGATNNYSIEGYVPDYYYAKDMRPGGTGEEGVSRVRHKTQIPDIDEKLGEKEQVVDLGVAEDYIFTHQRTIHNQDDIDSYKVSLQSTGTLEDNIYIDIVDENNESNLQETVYHGNQEGIEANLYLLDGTTLVSQSYISTDVTHGRHFVLPLANLPEQEYIAKITSAEPLTYKIGASSNNNLEPNIIADQYDLHDANNDDFDNATQLVLQGDELNLTNLSLHSLHDKDYYKFQVDAITSWEKTAFEAIGDNKNPDIQLNLYDQNREQLNQHNNPWSQGYPDPAMGQIVYGRHNWDTDIRGGGLGYELEPNQDYYLEVTSNRPANYSLDLKVPSNILPHDQSVFPEKDFHEGNDRNDTPETAYNLGEVSDKQIVGDLTFDIEELDIERYHWNPDDQFQLNYIDPSLYNQNVQEIWAASWDRHAYDIDVFTFSVTGEQYQGDNIALSYKDERVPWEKSSWLQQNIEINPELVDMLDGWIRGVGGANRDDPLNVPTEPGIQRHYKYDTTNWSVPAFGNVELWSSDFSRQEFTNSIDGLEAGEYGLVVRSKFNAQNPANQVLNDFYNTYDIQFNVSNYDQDTGIRIPHASEAEPDNDEFVKAISLDPSEISVGITNVSGSLHTRHDDDWYKFSIENDVVALADDEAGPNGELNLIQFKSDLQSSGLSIDAHLFKESKSENGEVNLDLKASSINSRIASLDLSPGNYYLKVQADQVLRSTESTPVVDYGNYNFNLYLKYKDVQVDESGIVDLGIIQGDTIKLDNLSIDNTFYYKQISPDRPDIGEIDYLYVGDRLLAPISSILKRGNEIDFEVSDQLTEPLEVTDNAGNYIDEYRFDLINRGEDGNYIRTTTIDDSAPPSFSIKRKPDDIYIPNKYQLTHLEISSLESTYHPVYGEYINLLGVRPGEYELTIGPGVAVDYSLEIKGPPAQGLGDKYEQGDANDVKSKAVVIDQISAGLNLDKDLSIHYSEDIDVFKFSLPRTGTINDYIQLISEDLPTPVVNTEDYLGYEDPAQLTKLTPSGLDKRVELVLSDAWGARPSSIEIRGGATGFIDDFRRFGVGAQDSTAPMNLHGLPAGDYYLSIYSNTDPEYIYGLGDFDSFTPVNYTLLTNLPSYKDTESLLVDDLYERLEDNESYVDLGNVSGGHHLEQQYLGYDDIDIRGFSLGSKGTEDSGLGIRFNHQLGDVKLDLISKLDNSVLASSNFSNHDVNSEWISLDGFLPGEYAAVISGSPNRYSLDITDGNQTPVSNRLGNNTTIATAVPLSAGQTSNLYLDSGNDAQYYKFTTNYRSPRLWDNDQSFLELNHWHQLGNLDIELLNKDGSQLIDYSYKASNDEKLTLAGLPADDYVIKVIGRGDDNVFDLNLSLPTRDPAFEDIYDNKTTKSEIEDALGRGETPNVYNVSSHLTTIEDLINNSFVPPGEYEYEIFEDLKGTLNPENTEDWYQGVYPSGLTEQTIEWDHTSGDLKFQIYERLPGETALTEIYGGAGDLVEGSAGHSSGVRHAGRNLGRGVFWDWLSGDTALGLGEYYFRVVADNITGTLDYVLPSFESAGFEKWKPANPNPNPPSSVIEPLGDVYEDYGSNDWFTSQRRDWLDFQAYELDNSLPSGQFVGKQKLTNTAISDDYDVDIYEFKLRDKGSSDHYIKAEFDQWDMDLDLYLFDQYNTAFLSKLKDIHYAGGPNVKTQISQKEVFWDWSGRIEADRYSLSNTNNEEISLHNLERGEYFAVVFPHIPNTNAAEYDLEFNLPQINFSPDYFEANDGDNDAFDLGSHTGHKIVFDFSIHTVANGEQEDIDYFKFETLYTGQTGDYINLGYFPNDGELEFELLDESFLPLSSSINTDSIQTTSIQTHQGSILSLDGLDPGKYTIKVSGVNSSNNNYDIYTNLPTNPDRLDAWTMMYYLPAFLDINFELVVNHLEAQRKEWDLPDDVNFAVMWDQPNNRNLDENASTGGGAQPKWNTVGRSLLRRDQTTKWISSDFEVLDEVNMGDPKTVTDFIKWANEVAPAENQALIISGHSSGLGSIVDDIEVQDPLEVEELSQELEQLKKNEAIDLEILRMNGCYTGTLEFAYELKDSAQVSMGSQSTAGAGTGTWLSHAQYLNKFPHEVDAKTFAITMVNDYRANYSSSRTQAFSAIESNKLESIAQTLSDFVDTTDSLSSKDRYRIEVARSFAKNYNHRLIDLGQFMHAITNASELDDSVKNAAQNVVDAIQAAVIHKNNGSGLSIFYPQGGGNNTHSYIQSHSQFHEDTQWYRFLEGQKGLAVSNSGNDYLLTPVNDWASGHEHSSNPFQLGRLSGKDINIDSIAVDEGTSKYFRFTLAQAGQADSNIQLFSPEATSLADIKLSLINSDNQYLVSDENSTINIHGLAAGDYVVRVENNGLPMPSASLKLDLPSDSNPEQNTNTSINKAERLGVLGGPQLTLGTTSPSTPVTDGDWLYYSIETPSLSAIEQHMNVEVNVADGVEYEAVILDSNNTVVTSTTGSGSNSLEYLSTRAGEQYTLKFRQLKTTVDPNQFAPIETPRASTFSLLFTPGDVVAAAVNDDGEEPVNDDNIEAQTADIRTNSDIASSWAENLERTLDSDLELGYSLHLKEGTEAEQAESRKQLAVLGDSVDLSDIYQLDITAKSLAAEYNLETADITINFDPYLFNDIKASDITIGGQLPIANAVRIDNDVGTIRIAAASLGDLDPGDLYGNHLADAGASIGTDAAVLASIDLNFNELNLAELTQNSDGSIDDLSTPLFFGLSANQDETVFSKALDDQSGFANREIKSLRDLGGDLAVDGTKVTLYEATINLEEQGDGLILSSDLDIGSYNSKQTNLLRSGDTISTTSTWTNLGNIEAQNIQVTGITNSNAQLLEEQSYFEYKGIGANGDQVTRNSLNSGSFSSTTGAFDSTAQESGELHAAIKITGAAGNVVDLGLGIASLKADGSDLFSNQKGSKNLITFQGDLNYDGRVSMKDLAYLNAGAARQQQASEDPDAVDANGDGFVDASVARGVDANFDGQISMEDLAVLDADWGQSLHQVAQTSTDAFLGESEISWEQLDSQGTTGDAAWDNQAFKDQNAVEASNDFVESLESPAAVGVIGGDGNSDSSDNDIAGTEFQDPLTG
ncbi:clostripain-related cysteine peptidase [Prochlorococcus sp. MIT 1227]|uniref:clostripain-related cysteine peptidase n=1 Tax=Prochlorococcus sp. MIT 1227 TaxID=3082536 RepID=UPI0039A40A53